MEESEPHPPTPVIGMDRDLSTNRPSSSSTGEHSAPDVRQLNQDNESYLSQLLRTRELQCADRLFTISDYELITELHSALRKIKKIFNEPSYVKSQNDQSIVDLVLARLTAAIRETCCIETYAPALVDILEACLVHRMYAVGADNQLRDSPHCKIALEVLSTLFMYHNSKSVMTVAIPVGMKVGGMSVAALGNSNHDELVRNVTSYLALAAIHNARVLAQYSLQIISSIINGNHSLVRVLPQLYAENREPFHAHLTPLFRILHYSSTDVSEKLSLLQLASMVANSKPDLIVAHLSEFDELLLSSTTCTAVLHLYLTLLSMDKASALAGQLLPMRRAARHALTQNNLLSMAKIIGAVGRLNHSSASIAVHDLCNLCEKCNLTTLPFALGEIESIAQLYPPSVLNSIDAVRDMSEHQPAAFSLYMRLRSLMGEERLENSRLPPRAGEDQKNMFELGDFIINSLESMNSAQSKKSLQGFPNDPSHVSSGAVEGSGDDRRRPPNAPPRRGAAGRQQYGDKSVEELDQAMQTLADSYRLRSNGAMGLKSGGPRSRSHLTLMNSSQLNHRYPTTDGRSTGHHRISSPSPYGGKSSYQPPPYAQAVIENPPCPPQRSSVIDSVMSRPSSTLQQQNECILHQRIAARIPAMLASPMQHTTNPPTSSEKQRKKGSRVGNTAQREPLLQRTEILPPLTMVQSYCGQTPFQLGKDGRVRPVSMHRTRHYPPPWAPSAASLPLYECFLPTTTFPVSATGSLIKTTAATSRSPSATTNNPKTRGQNESGSGSVPKMCIDEHATNKTSSRAHSTDTVSNLGNAGSSGGTLRRAAGGAGGAGGGGIGGWRPETDLVQQFVQHRRSKIMRYVAELTLKYPIPARCVVEHVARKGNNNVLIQFTCQANSPYCVYGDSDRGMVFSLKTKIPAVWLHLMFLQQEVAALSETGKVLTQGSEEFRLLDHCWTCLPKDMRNNRPFVTVVTSAFPSVKEQTQMLKELQAGCYFDSFSFSAQLGKWICFSCAHPERVKNLLRDEDPNTPLLEGQLKEKRSKWNPFRRWHTRYFTLSGAALTSHEGRSHGGVTASTLPRSLYRRKSPEFRGGSMDMDNPTRELERSLLLAERNPTIELCKIRSVKSLKGRRRKQLPKAFEVFTVDNNTYVFKANDRSQAERWFQSLQIAVAQAQKDRDRYGS